MEFESESSPGQSLPALPEEVGDGQIWRKKSPAGAVWQGKEDGFGAKERTSAKKTVTEESRRKMLKEEEE